MRVVWALLAFVALVGCRSSATPATHAPARGGAQTLSDRTGELLAFAPVGADRCVVARPSRLGAAERALIASASQADALAFHPELTVDAFAELVRERHDGLPWQVLLFWFEGADGAVRKALGGLRLAWDVDADACAGRACPARARFIASHVLRIERGEPAIGSSPGAEAHCKRLAQRYPAALELSFARSRALLGVTLGVLPLTASSITTPNANGVHVERLDLMRSSEDAEQVVSDRSAADVLLGPLSALASGMRRQHTDAEVRTDYDLLWEDLAFAREAEARVEAADREAAAIERAELDTDREPETREEVIAQLGQMLERIRESSGEARVTQARAASVRLEQALARDPDDEGLGLLLAELYLSELNGPDPANALVQRFGSRPGASPRWPELKRHTAALRGETALASALVAAKLAQARRARGLAAEIIARLREGAGYLEAERAVLGQERAAGGGPAAR